MQHHAGYPEKTDHGIPGGPLIVGTLSERILGGSAGDFVDRKVDRAYVHDGTGVLTLMALREMGAHVVTPARFHVIFDHIVPANTSLTADLQSELRTFAQEQGMCFSDVGNGICHQLMGEGEVLPGEVVAGADSHTCTLGAFGAFATGMGATDLAGIWASGATWFRVPETIAIRLHGELTGAAEPKDVALQYVSLLGMEGATYRAIEFIGTGAATIPMHGRLTLCNMAVESGAKTGMFFADAVTTAYLRGFGKFADMQETEPCTYEREISIDLGAVRPLVAVPPRVDTVKNAAALAGTAIDQVFVGTCTNGRFEDLARFAHIVKGKQVKVRTIVVPASRTVLERLEREGHLGTIIRSGCVIGPAGCGPCLGAHMGVIGKGEVCLSTANRNFSNRMGVGGAIYLSSVATAAVSALNGEITEPEADDVR
ncbi:MAG: 3-isopropylmalate dehydratase/homoaconitate hydratase family large subunit [Methanomicrobiales archaeon]|nr:3-isopropylmalate dehydratase/homoaconitate hydratase family large subunit [Methanomicrobiales archaeon]